MNRKDFGQLVAVLRSDLGWTQTDLAEYANLDEAVISNIERGAKKHLEPEHLFALANALQLTSLERRQFLVAASGLEPEQIVRQPNLQTPTNSFDHVSILEQLLHLLEKLQYPAYLADPYGDVLGANLQIVHLMGIPHDLIEQGAEMFGGYNILRILFDEELGLRQKMGEAWEDVAVTALYSFRESSMLQRTHPYFRSLIRTLNNPNKYPGFNRLWRKAGTLEEDKNEYLDQYAYEFENFGSLSYINISTVFMTSAGDLHIVHFIPTSPETNQIFSRIRAETGSGFIRLASWPQKTFVA